MSSQVLEVLMKARNETRADFQELNQDAKLTAGQIKELFNASEADRARLLADFKKTTEAVHEAAGATQDWSEKQQRASMAMAGAHDQAIKMNEAFDETHRSGLNLGEMFQTGLGIGAFLTVAGLAETALHEIKEILREVIFGTAEYAEKNELAALKLGMSVEATQRLGLIARVTQSSLEQVTSAVVMMERRVADNVDGAADALRKLQISPEVFKDPEEAVLALSRALREIPDHQEQISIGYGLMGRGASNIMPILLQDLDKLEDRAKGLATTMSTDNVMAAAQFQQETELLREAWDGLLRSLGTAVVTDKNVAATLRDLGSAVGYVSDLVQKGKPLLQGYWKVVTDPFGLGTIRDTFLHSIVYMVDNVKNMWDGTAAATEQGAKAAATSEEHYFVETAAERAAYLQAVMENHDIEERDRKKDEANTNRYYADMLAGLKKHNAEVARRLDAHAKVEADEAAKRARIEKVFQETVDAIYKQEEADEAEYVREVRESRQQLLRDGQDFMKSWKEQIREEMDELLALPARIADFAQEVGGTIGGAFGSVLETIAGNFQNFIDRVKDGLFDVMDMAQTAFEVAAGAFKLGRGTKSAGKGALIGLLSGAATGAAIGSVVPGIGTVLGGVIGGGLGLIGGFFGGKKGQAEARAQMEDMRKQLLQQFGGMENLRKSASLLGVDISKAFSTNDPKVFQGVMDQLNDAMAAHQARLQGIQTAMRGLDLMTKGLTGTMERHGQATDADAAAFQRLGNYAAATFASMVHEGGDVIGALQQLEPTLAQLADLEKEFGVQGSAALQELLGLRQIVIDNADIAQSIQGLNLLMKGLGDAGITNAAIFQDFGRDAVADFTELTSRGVDANQALILMQPSLQQLWEHQQKFHDITDEATLALINQAEEAGIVGEDQKSIYAQILDVLKDIRDTIMGIPSDKYTTIHEDHHVTHSGDDGGDNGDDEGGPSGRGRAAGAWNEYFPAQPGGHWVNIAEGNRGEFLTVTDRPVEQTRGGGDGGRSAPVHVHVYLDGQEMKGWMKRQARAGRLELS